MTTPPQQEKIASSIPTPEVPEASEASEILETTSADPKPTSKLPLVLGTFMVTILILGVVAVEYGRAHYTNKSAPNQSLYSQRISGLSSANAQKQVHNILNNFLEQEVKINFTTISKAISHKDLGVTVEAEPTYDQIKFYHSKPSHKEFLQDLFSPSKLTPKASLELDDLETSLINLIPELDRSKSATFKWDQLNLVIAPATLGNNTDYSKIRQEILRFRKTITIPAEQDEPEIRTADLEAFKEDFSKLLEQNLTFTHKGVNHSLSLAENPDLIEFQNHDSKLTSLITPINFRQLLAPIASEIEVTPELLSIKLVGNKAEFSGIGNSGVSINYESALTSTLEYINSALGFNTSENANSSPIIALETKETPPILDIDPTLQARGITELLSTGYTTYRGSPANRIHNINVGTEIYNGLIIPKGENFSFNTVLGPVDASTGYLPELVIKSEGTIPEYGGGICQVSTTLYRGVVFGGFNVTERYNHSYVVSYYSQVLGDGLDATIYPGVKDLQFQNDTPGDLLIQAFTEGTSMTVRFFGTSDNRKVELAGPVIHGRSAAGAPIYEESAKLAPGETRQVESAVPGLITEWTQTITYGDDTVKENSIYSNFRAVAPKYLVGPSTPAAPAFSTASSPFTPVTFQSDTPQLDRSFSIVTD